MKYIESLREGEKVNEVPEHRHHANYQPACIFVMRTHAIDIVTQKKSAFKHFFLVFYIFLFTDDLKGSTLFRHLSHFR